MSQPDLKKLIYRRAQQLVEIFKGPPILYFSGGMKSELMLRAFIEQGLKFSVRIIKYDQCIWADFKRAMLFCNSNNVHYETVHKNENSSSYLQTLEDIKRTYKIDNFADLFSLEMMLTSPPQALFAGGLPWLLESNGHIKELKDTQIDWPRINFFADDKITNTYLNESLIEEWQILASFIPFHDNKYWEQFLFKQYWPDLSTRYRWSGFENFQSYEDLP